MTRLFWALLGAIIGSLALWFVARRRMDSLYGDVSRLREVEHKYVALLKKQSQEKVSIPVSETDDNGFEERMASASVTKKMRMAMLNTLYKDEAYEPLGKFTINIDGDKEF